MDAFQTNHLLNNEEFTEIHLIAWSPLRKGQTAEGHVIQMVLFWGLRQIWFSISSKSSFFLPSFFLLKQLINSGADSNSSLSSVPLVHSGPVVGQEANFIHCSHLHESPGEWLCRKYSPECGSEPPGGPSNPTYSGHHLSCAQG